MSAVTAEAQELKPRQELDSVVIRFAGDSGDGVQITGSQFTDTTALAGNDLATFPDFPAEIRAPIGTTFGVSAFQINFGSRIIETSGDAPDVLVALNPAALKVNLDELKEGGLVILDVGTFNARNFEKAGWASDPLEDDTLAKYRVVKIDISKLTLEAVKGFDVTSKEGLRCKNFWTLGLVYWLYGRDREPTVNWLNQKFAKLPAIADANIGALNAGHAFGETAEMPGEVGAYIVPPAELEGGEYRNVTGTDAMAWGLTAGAKLADIKLVFCSYPITPASTLLHSLARLKHFNVLTFQAEDEIAAVGAAVGVSYAGSLGVTSSSGPGVALKGEAIGLAVMTELPLIIVNSQRAGPSTGMPTKTEQSDLYQSVYGRNGDSPLIVLAARSPADCFEVGIEAVRLSTKYMTPVMVLSDTYIVNAAEPWMIPDTSALEPFPIKFHQEPSDFHPYQRNGETLARPWVKPGTPGLEHRIGGLEKSYDSGHISYDPENHHKMTMVRKEKIDTVAEDIPLQEVAQGGESGQLAVVGWGSTFGPISGAVERARDRGLAVSHIHLRHLWPMPRNLGELLSHFDKVLVPEMNTGQLKTVLRDQYLVPAEGFNRVTGKPFKISEIENAIDDILGG
ncbi:MAG: 2-oxoglutarate oxidoreductase subunit KorA [Alphaproteobacteria bacterium MarineAlpha4_Bin2]|nr:MAG: 2-oxoglutarate oxidoreductase subunit KorA [Alphaproteobacteria bacterium MarineAlpha4_Bin2]